MNNIKIQLLAYPLLFCGCMTPDIGQKYALKFDDAVSKGKNVGVISSLPFEEIKDKSLLRLKAMGYKKVVYAEPEQGFIVAVKRPVRGALLMADASAFSLMIKFTSVSGGQTRVDLVEGSTYLITNQSVRADISELADFIRSLG